MKRQWVDVEKVSIAYQQTPEGARVFDEDGDQVAFFAGEGWSPRLIRGALKVGNIAYEQGFDSGWACALRDVRKALGVEDAHD